MNNVFAAIDIGTNSIRLAVVRVGGEQRINTLAQHREVVRLGEGEFVSGKMTPEAIARGALVCARFAEVARGFGATEIISFATAATREADNREEFIEEVRREAGIGVRIISGVEEARLIWLGVSSGIELGEKRAMLIDIGGGSTEVIVGNSEGYSILESMKLGAIRLSNQFLQGEGPVSDEHFHLLTNFIRGAASQVARRVCDHGFDIALGSAGTINCLGEIVSKHKGDHEAGIIRGGNTFTRAELKDAVQMLRKLPLEARRLVPGMDPARADILIGGAAVLLTFMELTGTERLTTSDRGLREGILLDHILREDDSLKHFQSLTVRKRSVLQLAKACNYEAEHAEHTAFLALRLFDELRIMGEHPYGNTSRELLEYASILHDIGAFLSHSDHHRHAYYLIRNYDLLGFDDTEIDVMANVAFYHRKGFPKKRHPNMEGLDKMQRARVAALSSLLRVAEGLDRSHLGLVTDIRLKLKTDPPGFILTLLSKGDCELEMWGVQNSSDLFEYVFHKPLIAEVEMKTDMAMAAK